MKSRILSPVLVTVGLMVVVGCGRSPLQVNETNGVRYVTKYDFDARASRTYVHAESCVGYPVQGTKIDTITLSCGEAVQVGDTVKIPFNYSIATSNQTYCVSFASVDLDTNPKNAPITFAVVQDTAIFVRDSIVSENYTTQCLLDFPFLKNYFNIPVDSESATFDKNIVQVYSTQPDSCWGWSFSYATNIGLLHSCYKEIGNGWTDVETYDLVSYNGAPFCASEIKSSK